MDYCQNKVRVVIEKDDALDVAHRDIEVPSDLPVLQRRICCHRDDV
jgi:hypothetical protein